MKNIPNFKFFFGHILNFIFKIYPNFCVCVYPCTQSMFQFFYLFRDILTLHAVDRLSQYYKDLMKLSHECRRAHEQGDFNTTERSAAETNKNHPDFSNTDSALQNKTLHAQTNSCEADSPATSPNPLDTVFRPSTSHCEELRGRNQEKLMAHKSEQSRISSRSNSRPSFIEMKMADSPMSNHHNAERSSPT